MELRCFLGLLLAKIISILALSVYGFSNPTPTSFNRPTTYS